MWLTCYFISVYAPVQTIPTNLAMSAAGPSRLQSGHPPPAPSTSGDSESTVPQPVEKGLDVSILRELAKSTLIESLNEVSSSDWL